MNAARKLPSVGQGVALALALSLAGAALYFVLGGIFTASTAWRLVVPLLGFVYVCYLLANSHERVGRITTIVLWMAAGGVLWMVAPPPGVYVLIHVGMLWLVRALYFHAGVLPALADLVLHGLALAFAAWAAGRTGSVFLALWCFFLVQSLFVLIPATFVEATGRERMRRDEDEAFLRAQRTAEAALRKLAASR